MAKNFNYIFISRYTEEAQELFVYYLDILFEEHMDKKALLSKLTEEVFPKKMQYYQGIFAKNNTGFLVGSGLTVADLNLLSILTEQKKSLLELISMPFWIHIHK